MDKFNNAWIFPDGHSKYTKMDSHMIALMSFGIQEELYEKARSIQFTDEELKHHYDFDIGYIAMKLGYIRVVSFINQFAVQYIKPPTLEQANEIIQIALKMQRNSSVTFECFVIEKFQQRNATFSKSFEQFKLDILKKVE